MSQSLVYRDCPVCGSNAAQSHWQKGELHLGRCGNCGMVYANPVPSEMATGEFYDAAGTDYYLSPAKLQSDYADVRFERELRLFRKHCRGGAVLDVGCSSGAFLFQLRKRWPADYQILGTDVSGPPLDYAESRGVPVMRGNFLEQDFVGKLQIEAVAPHPASGHPLPIRWGEGRGEGIPPIRFDAVTFWAVLEHLAEPKLFLEKAHSLLKPGGLCLVLVPNFNSLATRLLGVRYRYVYPQHLNYFTRTTLSRLAVGRFEVVAARFTHFNPVVIWQDWRGDGREVSNAERGELLQRTTALKQKPWMKPVKGLYGLAEKALGSIGLADNVVVVMRRPKQ